MEYVLIITIVTIFLGIVTYVFDLHIKRVKEISNHKRLDEISKEFPENQEIAKKILEKLNNRTVKIKEDPEAKANLYLIYNNSIIIANIKDTFTRVQTIAHECIHSTQNKRMLWFNFIYTNCYMLYFVIIMILTGMKVITNSMFYLSLLIFFGMIQYLIRSMLETEAMLKAQYVAKDYLEENEITSKEIIEEIVEQYEELNQYGIRIVSEDILIKNTVKIILYCTMCIIFL